ncbi:MAG: transposase [Phycisphaerae bacterium]|nr:transposase [Phycisphaerae bacterium]
MAKENTHVRTLKLKLSVVAEDKKAVWKRIYQITSDAWKAANWIASGQYLNDQMIRRVYARRKIDPTNMESVQKVEEEFATFFGTKRQATTERDIKQEFPDLPSCVTNSLNQVVVASYGKEKRDMLAGTRSLRSYRQGMPVQTSKASIEFSVVDGEHVVTWKLGGHGDKAEHITFRVYYGRDKANFRLIVQRILDGEQDYDYSAPTIQLKDRDLFLLLPVREPNQDRKLNPDLSVGVDLGVVCPAYVAASEGTARRPIGFEDDLLKTRMQMQWRHRRLQASVVSARGGHGRERKTRAMERVKEAERNFVHSYNHMISKRVVEFAVQQAAGTIKMEMLEGFGEEESQAFILRNWSYFELQRLIKEKALREGIKVVLVDPFHTSQTCSQCGNYTEGQRPEQAKFLCAACGADLNADYNAALNIARSSRVVTKKEECEYHKLKQRSGHDGDQTYAAGPTAEG